jgi:uncharacterized membrane protein YjgN (DUF898 family)
MNKDTFQFLGTGLGCLWLTIWTSVLTFITLGLFFPWSYSAWQRWIAQNTYVNGRRLVFTGSGGAFFLRWLLIVVLSLITFGLYAPWGYCLIKRWETDNLVFEDEQAGRS